MQTVSWVSLLSWEGVMVGWGKRVTTGFSFHLIFHIRAPHHTKRAGLLQGTLVFPLAFEQEAE